MLVHRETGNILSDNVSSNDKNLNRQCISTKV